MSPWLGGRVLDGWFGREGCDGWLNFMKTKVTERRSTRATSHHTFVSRPFLPLKTIFLSLFMS